MRNALSRRSVLSAGVVGIGAIMAPSSPAAARRPGGKAGWETDALRWAQVAFTEDDPGRYDPAFWRDYFQRTKAEAVCLSAGGSIAFYPSRLADQNRSAGLGDRDPFGEMVRIARDLDMAVMARIDPHAMTQAQLDKHPEWVARNPDGSPRRHWAAKDLYVTCGNGPFNFDFMTKVIGEITTRYRADGIFGNRWSGHGGCYCESCRTLFKAATGHPLPTSDDPADPVRRAFMTWEHDRLLLLIDHWNRAIVAANPNAFFVPGVDARPGPKLDLDVAELGKRCRMFVIDRQARVALQAPWLNGKFAKETRAFMDAKPICGLSSVGVEETYRWKDSVQGAAELKIWMADGLAQGLRPWFAKFNAKPIDTRWMPVVEKIFLWHARNERYFRNEANLARVAILASPRTAAFYYKKTGHKRDDDHTLGYYQALIEARIPFEAVHTSRLDRLSRFDVLVMPNVAALSDAECAQIRAFVMNGGTIVATQETSLYDEWGVRRANFGLADLFGCDFAGTIEPRMQNAYLALHGDGPIRRDLTDTPRTIGPVSRVHVTARAPLAETPLTLIPTYPDLPMERVYTEGDGDSGAPMLFLRQIGKGKVAYMPMDLDRTFQEIMAPDHLAILRNVVEWAMPAPPPLQVEGPGLFDIALWRQKGSLTAHIVNMTNPMTMKGPYRDILPSGRLSVSIALPAATPIARVRLLEADADVAYVREGDRLRVEIPSVAVHEIVAIDLI
ncbi:beta-galactosidase trimerization domain-containing protein [Sphingomonas naphthae]|uniref:Beta-galactosidase trimerization domain-containing protein n=1 Tax=Sphingomonas naphthae TaxID=1813468 RepID=A0ABY7TMI1_9SPHN|nr:alpha-amylase family protein [Sphingomonas naphthae]WCT74160.1 beta-galactosidase trimerization domain-containing protein [Sphingomonas naphthae]